MEVLRDQSGCPRPPGGTAVTIGAYDGVHLGHRQVIAEVRRRAEARGMASAVVTFDRHPASVVRPDSAPKLLTDLDQKLELLAATGLDYCLVITFDEERSRESAEDFVHGVLADCLNARVVVVGEDFHFGHGRSGDVALLTKLGRELGFEVEGIELVDTSGQPTADDAERVSSTRIRRALDAGDLVTANRLLGRAYEVRGTASSPSPSAVDVLVPADLLVPSAGSYAGWYERADGSVHPAALQVGPDPTPSHLIQVQLLDGGELGDIGDPAAKVRFVQRLRGDGSDVDEARRVLADS